MSGIVLELYGFNCDDDCCSDGACNGVGFKLFVFVFDNGEDDIIDDEEVVVVDIDGVDNDEIGVIFDWDLLIISFSLGVTGEDGSTIVLVVLVVSLGDEWMELFDWLRDDGHLLGVTTLVKGAGRGDLDLSNLRGV